MTFFASVILVGAHLMFVLWLEPFVKGEDWKRLARIVAAAVSLVAVVINLITQPSLLSQ